MFFNFLISWQRIASFDVQREGKEIFSKATVVETDFLSEIKRAKFHFYKVQSKHDEWIPIDSPRIAPYMSYTRLVPIEKASNKVKPKSKISSTGNKKNSTGASKNKRKIESSSVKKGKKSKNRNENKKTNSSKLKQSKSSMENISSSKPPPSGNVDEIITSHTITVDKNAEYARSTTLQLPGKEISNFSLQKENEELHSFIPFVDEEEVDSMEENSFTNVENSTPVVSFGSMYGQNFDDGSSEGTMSDSTS